jgi:splicing factor 3B subunit 2
MNPRNRKVYINISSRTPSTMSISAAERNRRKRERKKAEKRKKGEEVDTITSSSIQVETNEVALGAEKESIAIEYVSEPIADAANSSAATSELYFLDTQPVVYEVEEDVEGDEGKGIPTKVTNSNSSAQQKEDDDNDILAVLRRFALRANVGGSSSAEEKEAKDRAGDESDATASTDEDSIISNRGGTFSTRKRPSTRTSVVSAATLSRRKIREWIRPTVAQLKQTVARPDLVEAHDVTAADPEFLLYLKGIPNTVPVPRHWGRKRKYLQGKRGIEKSPWPLPHFLRQTGIAEIRSSQAAEEAKLSLKQKQRQRVQVRSGIDVDYKTLYDAFFKYQTKPKLTTFGDLYYEGKELELRSSSGKFVPGQLSERLREALGMKDTAKVPPPWLMNMQRYGPPPTYPSLTIPGLNAPLPEGCSYGFHAGGWGKPPVDAYGRGLYGDVFGPPTEDRVDQEGWKTNGPDVITSDGKKLSRSFWGALPSVKHLEEEEEEEEANESEEEQDEMEASSEEEEGEEHIRKEGITTTTTTTTTMPYGEVPSTDGLESVVPSSAVDLRKVAGDETPAPKQLYTVLQTRDADQQVGVYFQSDTTYIVPTADTNPTDASGIESVLSKAPREESKRTSSTKRDWNEEDDTDLSKRFKF